MFIGSVTKRIPPERLLGWSIFSLGFVSIVIAIGQTVSITLDASLVAGAIILFGVASMNTSLSERGNSSIVDPCASERLQLASNITNKARANTRQRFTACAAY